MRAVTLPYEYMLFRGEPCYLLLHLILSASKSCLQFLQGKRLMRDSPTHVPLLAKLGRLCEQIERILRFKAADRTS